MSVLDIFRPDRTKKRRSRRLEVNEELLKTLDELATEAERAVDRLRIALEKGVS